MEKKWLTRDPSILNDCDKIQEYIKSIRAGNVPLYFESATIPPSDGDIKRLSGTDYDKFVA